MKTTKWYTLVMMLFVSLSLAAQSSDFDDDIYGAAPTKVAAPKKPTVVRQAPVTIIQTSTASVRDVDEYNRRYTDEEVTEAADTVVEYVDGELTERIVKFHDPSKVVIVADDIDVYYVDGRYSFSPYNSWYDSWYSPYYSYRSWWGPRYYGGWYSSWYSPWHYGWYDPWYYGGYWGGYYGWGRSYWGGGHYGGGHHWGHNYAYNSYNRQPDRARSAANGRSSINSVSGSTGIRSGSARSSATVGSSTRSSGVRSEAGYVSGSSRAIRSVVDGVTTRSASDGTIPSVVTRSTGNSDRGNARAAEAISNSTRSSSSSNSSSSPSRSSSSDYSSGSRSSSRSSSSDYSSGSRSSSSSGSSYSGGGSSGGGGRSSGGGSSRR